MEIYENETMRKNSYKKCIKQKMKDKSSNQTDLVLKKKSKKSCVWNN